MDFRQIFFIAFFVASCVAQETEVFKDAVAEENRGTSQAILIQSVLDATEDKSRPCPVYDTNCIRKYFASHAKCNIVYGPVPDPLFRQQTNYYFPNFNISASSIALNISGLNAEILDFYVEEKTLQLVLALRFRKLIISSTYDVYRFHRNGKEDAVTRSRSILTFPQVTTTTIFRLEDHLDLAKSETTVNVDVPVVAVLDPSAGIHPDPTVTAAFLQFATNPVIIANEGFLTGGPIIAGYFIQYSLCDYGLLELE